MSVQTGRVDEPTESDIFHILGNDRRRAIVTILADRRDAVDISTVATTIATDESETGQVADNMYKSVYVSLQQTHVPQLEAEGVVVYDSTAKTIEPGEAFDAVYEYVANGGSIDRLVLGGHLVAATIGLVTVALVGGDVLATAALDLTLVSVLLFVLIGASSLYALLA